MTMFNTYLRLFTTILVCSPYSRCDSSLLAQCAVQLLNVSNLMRTTVYVTTSPNVTHNFRSELLFTMHQNYKSALLLNEFHVKLFNPNRYILPHAYLVAANNTTDLVDHLDTINVTDASWRPEVNFIIILEKFTELSQRILEPLFQRLWIKNMFKSVLLIPAIDGKAIEAFYWYPFHKRCGEYHTPTLEDLCTRGDNNNSQWTVFDVFEKIIPNTFYNCTVNIVGFNWAPMTLLSNQTPRAMLNGMDVEVVKLMGRIGKVQLEFHEVENNQRWGVKLENGTWNGGFGELSRHRGDFLIGGGILTAERKEMFDSAPARQVIRFPIYTPLPRKLPYWQNMLNVFSGNFWLTLFVVFFLTSGLLWLSGINLPSEKRAFSSCGYCLVISWAIFCSVASGQQPTSVSSKMIFLSWVIYMLHISAVYTSMQLIYIYKPKYEPPMRTVNDVKESGLTICSVPTFIPIAHSMDKDNFNLTEYIPCIDMVASAKRLLKKKDIIILDPEDHFEALISGSIKKVNKVEEVVIVYNIGIFMQKGNPYKDILSKAQIIAYETGLHDKWRRDASPSRPIKKKGNIKVKKLSVDELQGAFIILICGLGISSVIFVFEWLFGSK